MRTAAYILVVICALLALVCYSLLVVASRADERAKKMARKWIEEHGDIVDNIQADYINGNNIVSGEITLLGEAEHIEIKKDHSVIWYRNDGTQIMLVGNDEMYKEWKGDE